MIQSVAVIGIGAMGARMARRIQKAGFELTVCDRNDQALAAFGKAGARITKTPADCAGADLVVIMVSTPDQMRDVVLGPQGLVAGLSGQRPPILAVMSTVPVESLQDLAQTLRPHGVRVIDAPVSGGAPRAEEGTLTIMMGGDRDDLATATPVFSCMGTQLFDCGELGAAQTMKIVNNILGIANAVFAAEAYRIAIEQGLDPAHVARVLEVSTGRNFLSADPDGLKAAFATMAQSRSSFASVASIMRKDIGLASEMAACAEGSYPALQGFKALVDALGDETLQNWRRVGGLPPDAA